MLFCSRVVSALESLFASLNGHGKFSRPSNNDLFVPVLPLLYSLKNVNNSAGDSNAQWFDDKIFAHLRDSSESALCVNDVNRLLDLHKRTLVTKHESLVVEYGSNSEPFEPLVIFMHVRNLIEHYLNGMDYLEELLMRNLVSAIGKKISTKEFDAYATYSDKRLLRKEYQPHLFSYAIRKEGRYPEGALSITRFNELVPTLRYELSSLCALEIPVDSSTTVLFSGPKFLHSWMLHRFQFEHSWMSDEIVLNARARQFSSFILLIGNMESSVRFLPKAAIIVQNKDDLKIPLMLEQLPSAKEFDDFMIGLSSEQQRFAGAYREMQLETSLFGVCVLEIKPQLEKLLNLPSASLTKEIQLTQSLMDLFIKFQIPSDLLSYSGEDSNDNAKVNQVRKQVEEILRMIAEEKVQQLRDEEMERKFNNEEKQPYRMKTASLEFVEQPGMPASYFAPDASMLLADMDEMASVNSKSHESGGRTSLGGETIDSADSHGKIDNSYNGIEESSQAFGDFIQISKQMERRMTIIDHASARVRPTTVTPGVSWKRTLQRTLLGKPTHETLLAPDQSRETNQAFELIDALSRSGALSFNEGSFHVISVSTHWFDKTLMDAIIQDNVNPIEIVERSTLLAASVLFDKPIEEIISKDQLSRVKNVSSMLFDLE